MDTKNYKFELFGKNFDIDPKKVSLKAILKPKEILTSKPPHEITYSDLCMIDESLYALFGEDFVKKVFKKHGDSMETYLAFIEAMKHFN